MAEKLWEGIPRREVPWHPSVDEGACVSCRACIEFCPSKVYDWDDERDVPIVARPEDCVVYCMGCARACPAEAIRFPDKEKIVALVQELRQKYARVEKA
jgi:NAD-dependent dihydropyrimidine dehydrogenase PreA subunit